MVSECHEVVILKLGILSGHLSLRPLSLRIVVVQDATVGDVDEVGPGQGVDMALLHDVLHEAEPEDKFKIGISNIGTYLLNIVAL
jgi:hypothetical protein